MSKPLIPDRFYLVLKDEDRGLFNLVGPMSDNSPWISKVRNAQNQGRKVFCFAPSPGHTRESTIHNVVEQLGLAYTDEVIV